MMLMTFEDVEIRSPIELSRDEIRTISEEISLKYAPFPIAGRHAREQAKPLPTRGSLAPQTLSYQELQSISQEVSDRFAPKSANLSPEIFLLPVDPQYLYAYWSLGAIKTTDPSGLMPQKPLMLRIFWQPAQTQAAASPNIWFDVPADNAISRKKIRLPVDDTHYAASLGWLNPDHSLDALAHSNLVHVPTAPGKKHAPEPKPAHRPATEDPIAIAAYTLQNILTASREDGVQLSERWSVKLHLRSPADPVNQFAKLYLELMTLFDNRIDAELVPANVQEPEPETATQHASGLGR